MDNNITTMKPASVIYSEVDLLVERFKNDQKKLVTPEVAKSYNQSAPRLEIIPEYISGLLSQKKYYQRRVRLGDPYNKEQRNVYNRRVKKEVKIVKDLMRIVYGFPDYNRKLLLDPVPQTPADFENHIYFWMTFDDERLKACFNSLNQIETISSSVISEWCNTFQDIVLPYMDFIYPDRHSRKRESKSSDCGCVNPNVPKVPLQRKPHALPAAAAPVSMSETLTFPALQNNLSQEELEERKSSLELELDLQIIERINAVCDGFDRSAARGWNSFELFGLCMQTSNLMKDNVLLELSSIRRCLKDIKSRSVSAPL